jgi:hypothetical protein
MHILYAESPRVAGRVGTPARCARVLQTVLVLQPQVRTRAHLRQGLAPRHVVQLCQARRQAAALRRRAGRCAPTGSSAGSCGDRIPRPAALTTHGQGGARCVTAAGAPTRAATLTKGRQVWSDGRRYGGLGRG